MNIAIIGCGSMGKAHTYAINNLKYYFSKPIDVTIKTVCAAHESSAKEFAKTYGIPNYTDNEDDAIYDESIDIIDICTPNIYHFETAKKAILAGKNIYCEKPLCINYSEAKELAELAKEKGVYAQIVFNNRFLSAVLCAKELIESGRIGRILSFDVKYYHSSATDKEKRATWKQNSDICGAGTLFDLGSHAVDLAYYLMGEFDSVFGKSQIAYEIRKGADGEDWETNGDEAFYIFAKLKNGACGNISVSKIAVGTNDDLRFEIYGELGSLKFNLMDINYLDFYDGTKKSGNYGIENGYTRIECVNRYPLPGGIFPSVKAPLGWIRGHIGSYYSFLDAIENKKETSPSFEDGAYVQKILDTAKESDKKGIEMKIE